MNESMALDTAIESLAGAIDRDPFQIGLWRMVAQLHLHRARGGGNATHYTEAIHAARRSLELYPQDPQGLILLGDVEAAAGEALNDSTHIDSAIKHYRRALELDDQRLWWEKLRRMSPKERRTVEQKIERLRDEG